MLKQLTTINKLNFGRETILLSFLHSKWSTVPICFDKKIDAKKSKCCSNVNKIDKLVEVSFTLVFFLLNMYTYIQQVYDIVNCDSIHLPHFGLLSEYCTRF